MTVEGPVFAAALGGLAAIVHLTVTRARAALVARGGVTVALATLPLCIALPGLFLFAAIVLAPASAWSSICGFWVVRSHALARAGGW